MIQVYQGKLKNRQQVRIEIIQNVLRPIIIFLNNIYNKFYNSFHQLMCKITFSNIIQENSLRKGLFQLFPDQKIDHQQFSESSTNPEEQNFAQNASEAKARKDQQIEDQIFEWFTQNLIYRGNPDDLVHSHIQKQKTIIVPKKLEFMGLSGNKLKMNNLLSRRTTKLLQVNVAG